MVIAAFVFMSLYIGTDHLLSLSHTTLDAPRRILGVAAKRGLFHQTFLQMFRVGIIA